MKKNIKERPNTIFCYGIHCGDCPLEDPNGDCYDNYLLKQEDTEKAILNMKSIEDFKVLIFEKKLEVI